MTTALHDHGFFHNDGFFDPGWHLGFPEILIGLLFFALQVAFWVAVIVIVVRLIRGRGERPERATALGVLEERYARGEIDRDEFVERREVLLGRDTPRSTPPSDPPAQVL